MLADVLFAPHALRNHHMTQPLILIDPLPRTLDVICTEHARAHLQALGRIVLHDHAPMPDAMVDEHLPETVVLVGQTRMDRSRLQRAKKLRAIINVETNFIDNIDYEYCFDNGIHVLTPGSAFADVVAESALAMAIDLARGITRADREMRRGKEAYGLDGNVGNYSLMGARVGLIGFGDLARSFHRLVQPFNCSIKVYDPWVPDYVLHKHGCMPAGLDDVLSSSQVIVVFAGVTAENQGFLGHRELSLIQKDAAFLLMSRAAVVDFPVFLDFVRQRRFRAATDVFPVEPVAPDDSVRDIEGLLLSAHRTGGMPSALFDIGDQMLADATLIIKGLPPVVCRKAQRETVARFRSKPVTIT
jgi:phosphoglycerate dehydrogenase-like enzyme